MRQEEERERSLYDSGIYGKYYVIFHFMTFYEDLSMHAHLDGIQVIFFTLMVRMGETE